MKSILILMIIAIPNFLISQIDIERKIIDDEYVTTSSVRYTNDDTDYLPDEVIGTPFENEIFQSGTIYEENASIINHLFFRYNAFKDDIEAKENLKDPDNKIMVLKKLPNVMVKIATDYYMYSETNKGYYKVLFVGNNYKLCKKVYKKLYKAKQAENSFDRDKKTTFEDRSTLYLISTDDNYYKIPSSKNKRINFFGNKKDEIKTYVKKYKLDISDEKIFIKVVRYFDSMKDATL